jgi:plasmid segregation protein ParM
MKLDVFALDIGYSNLKVAYGEGAIPQVVVMPAGVGPVEACTEDLGAGLGSHNQAESIDIGGRQFVAGIDQSYLRVKRNRHPDYPMSDEYLALYYRALRLAAAGEIDTLVTGVPVEQHRDGKFCERLAERLRGRHEIKTGLSVSVKEVFITAQPIGAFADATVQMGSEGDRQIIRLGRVLVVDPGFYSNDWALFDQGRLVRSASGSNNNAMGQVLEDTVQRIEKELHDRVKVDRIEQALRRGAQTVLFHGEHLDFTPYLHSALEAVNRENTTDLLNTKNFEREQVDLVILGGGGAEYFRTAVKQAFPGSRIEVLPRPVAANVRGYWYMQRARRMATTMVAAQGPV